MQRIVRDNEMIGLMEDDNERLLQTYLNTRCLSKNGTDVSFKRSNLASGTPVLTKDNSVGWKYYEQNHTDQTTFTGVNMEMKDGKIVISNLYRNTPFYYNISYIHNSIIDSILEKNGNEIDASDVKYVSITQMNMVTNSTPALYMENKHTQYISYIDQYTGLLFTDSIYMSMTGGYTPPAPWHLQSFIISIGNDYKSYSENISIEPTYDYSKLGPDNKNEYCKFYLIGNNYGQVQFGSDSCPEYGGTNKIFNPNNSIFIYHENVLDYLNPSIRSYFTTSTHSRALPLNEPIFLHAKNTFDPYKIQTITFFNELNLLFELNDISELSGDSIESSLICATTDYTNRDIKFRHGKTYVLLLTPTIPDIVSVNPDKKDPTFTLTNFFKTKNDKPITGKIQ